MLPRHEEWSRHTEVAADDRRDEHGDASMTFSAERAEVQQAFRGEPHLNPPMPGIGHNYALLSAPIALALGTMKKNLAAEVARLSGGEASGFANRGELEANLGTLANHIRSRYLLSFWPTSKAPGLHALAVRVGGIRSWWWRRGVVIGRWRRTAWVDEPLAWSALLREDHSQ